ncbi:ATP synthase F0 subunit B [Cyanobacterium sp. uoEpiScrs1]|uniref:ATP synthase F0 subunit B n=1 Tax=Cyanobacterium sp. uoEpiScrs1 TaxID=2976343 RepID=UPI00226AB7F5|nr:ATP synthase F0 subunit B [Cyanobacterium sp. uoEpiScrs1]
MLRRNPPSRNETVNHQNKAMTNRREVDFDIQQELAHLQEMIYESFHIPLTRWTMIDEAKLIDQLDLIGEKLPQSIRQALMVLEQEEQLLTEAEAYAQQIIQSAKQQAAQILDETRIIQQAQQEANQLRQQVQQDCETMQKQSVAEMEQLHQVTMEEIQKLRQQSLAESQKLQEDADSYTDGVLTQLEQELNNMLNVIRNGRQQLHESSSIRSSSYSPKGSLSNRNQTSGK